MNKTASKPLYKEIYDYLADNIRKGKYDESKRLPSEKELSEEFRVSRITSKKALSLLAENGLIKRMPGKGSFVCKDNEYEKSSYSESVSAAPLNEKMVIGLVLTDFSESFGSGLLYGIEQEAARNGMYVCFRRSYESQKSEECEINGFLEMGVAGLIIMPVHGKHYNAKILKLVLDNFPIILIDRYLKGIDASFAGSDNIAGAKKATDYLLDLGHRNIAFISPPFVDTSTLEDRIEGFVQSHTEHGIAVDRSIWITDLISTIPGNTSSENLSADIAKIKNLLVENPHISCLFTAEYNIALIAEQAVKSLGKRIPDDVSILSFDGPGNIMGNHHFTHVRQNEYEIGVAAVRLLKEQLEHRKDKKIVYIEPELLLGASTKAINDNFK